MRRPVIVGTNSAKLPEVLNNIEKSVCSLNEAELLKMFSNNYATLRIAFANTFYDLAEQRNADYSLVKDLFFKVQHSQTYMEVPGHDGKRGFGGKCLPKDLDFLIDTLDEFNLDSRLFRYIRENNTVWNNKKY
jgi:UDPglucose 6-dehydrogenase